MSTKIFAEKLAASTRKAKNITTKPASNTHRSEKITTKSTTSAASTRKAKNTTAKPAASKHRDNKAATKKLATGTKAEKIISEAIPGSTSLTELADQQDLLNPVDLELLWKKKYLVRIWPD